MDEFSWCLCSDHIVRHNKQELYKININNGASGEIAGIQEGDVIGVSFDHIQLKFYVNGTEIDYGVTNVKGTVYPALYGECGSCREAQGIIVGCFSRRRRHLRRNLREFQLFAAVGLRENHAGAVVALVRHITSQYFFILFIFF
jgi:hypothetical protein